MCQAETDRFGEKTEMQTEVQSGYLFVFYGWVVVKYLKFPMYKQDVYYLKQCMTVK